MDNKNLDLTYAEAIKEIEHILHSLANEQNGIDTLAEKTARATELIAYCRKILHKAETDVNSLLKE